MKHSLIRDQLATLDQEFQRHTRGGLNHAVRSREKDSGAAVLKNLDYRCVQRLGPGQ